MIISVVIQIIIEDTVIAVNIIIAVIFLVGFLQAIKYSEFMNDGHIGNWFNFIPLYPWLHYVRMIGLDDIGVCELDIELIAQSVSNWLVLDHFKNVI